MDDEAPKTAYEIAMARLRRKDAESGQTEAALTDTQKAAIAEARQAASARLAQEEIMLKAALAQTFDPEARASLQENYRRDLQRINDDRDRKIAKIRAGSA